MDTIQITGGARIGVANATWPFVTLKVNSTKLELNASLLGRFVFQCQDIISIESYSGMFSKGIRINHRVSAYNSNIIFWTFKDPAVVINEIKDIGFLGNTTINTTEANEIRQLQSSKGFPLKKTFAIGFGVVWNLLFISEVINFVYKQKYFHAGTAIAIAIGSVFIVSGLTLLSKDFSRKILKEGRSVDDIKKFLYLLIFITGLMLFQLIVFRQMAYTPY